MIKFDLTFPFWSNKFRRFELLWGRWSTVGQSTSFRISTKSSKASDSNNHPEQKLQNTFFATFQKYLVQNQHLTNAHNPSVKIIIQIYSSYTRCPLYIKLKAIHVKCSFWKLPIKRNCFCYSLENKEVVYTSICFAKKLSSFCCVHILHILNCSKKLTFFSSRLIVQAIVN